MENAEYPAATIFDEKNPWKFCTDLDSKYHINCSRYQSQVFLEKSNTPNPFLGAGKSCEMTESILLKETCFLSLGYYIAQRSMGNYEEIYESCQLMPSKAGQDICAMGGAVESVFQKYTGYNETANKLCLTLEEEMQLECLTRTNVQNN